MRSHALPCTLMRSHALSCAPMHSHALPCTLTRSHALSCAPMHSHALPCTLTRSHARSCTPMHSHALPCTLMPSNALPCSLMDSHWRYECQIRVKCRLIVCCMRASVILVQSGPYRPNNIFQGFFISLVFLANKRVLHKMRQNSCNPQPEKVSGAKDRKNSSRTTCEREVELDKRDPSREMQPERTGCTRPDNDTQTTKLWYSTEA